jgi:hypothetical protein
MYTIRTGKAIHYKRAVVVLVAMTFCLTMIPGYKSEALADKGAAFLGGMVAGHVIGGAVRRDKARTAAAVENANQPRTVVVQQAAPAPAPAAALSPKQKIDQLDKLAAGGYITPAEYKAKKKAIVDGL